MPVEQDDHTGQTTTGHEWDGINELDTPIPKFVFWAYGLTALFAILFWILFPAFPSFSDFSRGVLGYSSRSVVLEQVEQGKKTRVQASTPLESEDWPKLAASADARKRFFDSAAVLYRDNCLLCHGRDARGQRGFTNLVDNQWLWPADAAEIALTIRHGINSGDDDERTAEMPAFGDQQMLQPGEIDRVLEYVLAFVGRSADAGKAEEGAALFKEHCVACHGPAGTGGLKLGAPSLVDGFWIYGSDRKSIGDTIKHGRKGVMPAWRKRLTETDIRKLALYIRWLNSDYPQKK